MNHIIERDGTYIAVALSHGSAINNTQPRMLLAHFTLTEDQANCAAYSALTMLAVQGDMAMRMGTIDLARPLLTPPPAEQQTVRA